MLFFCEECGERYSFSLEDVDPDKSSFPCGKCGFLIRLDYQRKKEAEKKEGNISEKVRQEDSVI
ncbi:MAG: hypothetical protein ACLFV2_04480 [Desulfurivibrionaceae bacterium]